MTNRMLHDLIDAQAAATPGASAIVAGDFQLSYAALAADGSRIASGLTALGCNPGDRIAYLGKNDPRIFQLMVAASIGGFVLVPLNWRLSVAELRAILTQSEARILLAAAEFSSIFVDRAGLPEILFALDPEIDGVPFFDTWRDAIDASAPVRSGDEDDVLVQLYTSGTTGEPKGVMLTHRNLLSLRTEPGQPAWEIPEPDAVALVAMPLFHVGGIAASFSILTTLSGGTVMLMPEFDPQRIGQLLATDAVTRLCLVPAMVRAIVDYVPADACRSPRLCYVMYGASPMTETLLAAAMARFDAGFVQLYGLTEVSGYVTTLSPEDHRSADPAIVASIGRPVPGVEIKIVDPSGASLPDGTAGEIWLRSAATMKGYFRKPEHTAEVIDAEGWFRTGDAGLRLASGHIVLKDRIKNMIISGGENIYPAEVENVIAACPGVADVAVIGIADERWGEVPKAFIVRSDPNLDPARLLEWLNGRIGRFKIPRSIAFVDVLPRNSTGKVLHRVLREQASAHAASPHSPPIKEAHRA